MVLDEREVTSLKPLEVAVNCTEIRVWTSLDFAFLIQLKRVFELLLRMVYRILEPPNEVGIAVSLIKPSKRLPYLLTLVPGAFKMFPFVPCRLSG